MTAHQATVALALAALVFGLAGVGYSARATFVQPDPLNGDPNALLSVIPEVQNQQWLAAQLRASEKAGQLNRIGGLLTAIAVVLGTAATLVAL